MSLAQSTHSQKLHVEVNKKSQVLLEVPIIVTADPPCYQTVGLRLHPSHA